LRAGVFLCGGGAHVPGIAQLAGRSLELPVTIGRTTSVNGLKSTLDQPEFATAIGLVKFGSFKYRKRDARPSIAKNLKNVFSKLLPR
jgi:cell division protein FtsA